MATLCALNLGQAGLAAHVLQPTLGPELVGQLQGGAACALAAPPGGQPASQLLGGGAIATLHEPAKNPTWPRLARLTPQGTRTPTRVLKTYFLLFFSTGRKSQQKFERHGRPDTHADTHTDTHTHTHRHTHTQTDIHSHTQTHPHATNACLRPRAVMRALGGDSPSVLCGSKRVVLARGPGGLRA